MKSVSASIIVLSGVLLFTLGSNLKHDLDDVSIYAGGILMLIGIIGWFSAMLEK